MAILIGYFTRVKLVPKNNAGKEINDDDLGIVKKKRAF